MASAITTMSVSSVAQTKNQWKKTTGKKKRQKFKRRTTMIKVIFNRVGTKFSNVITSNTNAQLQSKYKSRK